MTKDYSNKSLTSEEFYEYQKLMKAEHQSRTKQELIDQIYEFCIDNIDSDECVKIKHMIDENR